MKGKILVVDDEKHQRELIAEFFEEQGHDVSAADDGDMALQLFNDHQFDLVISDYKMHALDGVALLKNIKKTNPATGVILISAHGNIETAVQAMKEGADDFIVKPVNLEQLAGFVQRSLNRTALVHENAALRRRLEERYRFTNIVGESGIMQEVLNLAGRAAQSDATIMIRGESGTGKGLLANAIHLSSKKANGPFIEINCAALPPGVLESELFGHEKGAFTGADRTRAGRFELADHGTLFIDEVGDIPLEIQVKLLNVLQSGYFFRVGGEKPLHTDVRIIAATHRDLEKMVDEETFRQDLYYRLNVVSLVIPPLRERKSDVGLLIDSMISRFAQQTGKPIEGITAEALDCLIRYDYPGNVRELENALMRAVVLCRDQRIELIDLPTQIKQCGKKRQEKTSPDVILGQSTLPEMIEDLEQTAIRKALQQSGGIQTRAAKILGITERNIRYKMEKYSINQNDFISS